MKFRYVIIEDAAFVRELLKAACEKIEGHCVGESEGGSSGLELIRHTLPDVVFLDLVLPGQNGIELAKEIRRSWPEAVIIACTALDPKILDKKIKDVGISCVVTKPFTAKDIADAVRQQIYRKKEVAT